MRSQVPFHAAGEADSGESALHQHSVVTRQYAHHGARETSIQHLSPTLLIGTRVGMKRFSVRLTLARAAARAIP